MKKNLFLAALAIVALASCSDDTFVGDNSPDTPVANESAAISFGSTSKGITRADHVGADAANLLNKKFIVGGFKGNGTTMTTVFDNYTVEWDDNTAGTTTSNQWQHRGNIYGGGSGISLYEFDFNGDDDTEDEDISYHSETVKEKDHSDSSGSVTRFTDVNILGGTIHRNVYGGGSMGSVGAPDMGQGYLPYKRNDDDASTKGKQSQCTVSIGGGGKVTIGSPTDYNILYGGEVYGACRGLSSDNTRIGTSVWTKVFIKDGATIKGNVYGGGDNGMVKRDAEVRIGDEVIVTSGSEPEPDPDPTPDPDPDPEP